MKYGFIGCGNMGGAIARALRKKTDSIFLCDPSPVAQSLAAELGCPYGSMEQLARECDRIFLGVKPQVMAPVLRELCAYLGERRPLLISMAAGLTLSKLEEQIGEAFPIIRIMPNTPVAVGMGMISYCSNQWVEGETLASFVEDLQYAGELDALPENLIDAATAIAGCGPAFMYMYMEALADGAVSCGLPREKAMKYAAMTMAGAAQMQLSTQMHPGALKDAVCSPGGSTIVGVKALEENGLRNAAMESVISAYKRTVELGK